MARTPLPELLARLRSRSSETSEQAATTLQSRAEKEPQAFRDGSTVSVLLQLLVHNRWSVRMYALNLLEAAAPEETVRRVTRGLAHRDRGRRAAAAQRLHQIVMSMPEGMSAALRGEGRGALLEGARSEDGHVRNNAIQALGHLGIEEGIPLLVEALGDEEDGFVAGTAAIALERFGRRAAPALPGLVRLLGTGSGPYAAQALGALGAAGAEAIPALERARADAKNNADDELEEACQEALRKLRRAAKKKSGV